uniref:Uncharacterized protein n=1 Tax=Arundo donax TaxID=35708 RepID=A0A0A9A153_ARUDO
MCCLDIFFKFLDILTEHFKSIDLEMY